MRLNLKQTKALDFLEDDVTTEVEYGGAAGGGKSVLGCYWQIKKRLKFPGTRGLIGRASLTTLKDTTLNTFFEVAKNQGLQQNLHFNYNQQSNRVYFANGSLIFLKDLFQYPADPNFDDLGSLEITDAFVDENNQTTEKAWNIVKSRIRYKLDTYCGFCANPNSLNNVIAFKEGKPVRWLCKRCRQETTGLIPKMLGSCNPAKGWIYQRFYKLYQEKKLPADRQFVQALVTDNPDISVHYRNNLLGLDEANKQRLLFGNWQYEDDASVLIQYDKIIDCFTNTFIKPGERYITADIARFGKDKTVIGVWNGWIVTLFTYTGKSVTEVADIIKDLQEKFGVSKSNTIADEDGVGAGVVDTLKCKGFVNNSTALAAPDSPKDKNGNRIKENYSNLKSQCYYHLADRINNSGLYIVCDDIGIRESIIQELEQVKQHNMDKDGKKAVVPKDIVKELIGRSPDYSDTLMMREWFELTRRDRTIKIGNPNTTEDSDEEQDYYYSRTTKPDPLDRV